MLVEYARNVLGITDADHEETNPTGQRLTVTALACSLAGQEHEVRPVPGSQVHALYAADAVVEPFFCNYGLNADFRPAFEAHGLVFSAVDGDGQVRALELPGHPFFIATLYVPRARSQSGGPHPIIGAFVEAARRYAGNSAPLTNDK